MKKFIIHDLIIFAIICGLFSVAWLASNPEKFYIKKGEISFKYNNTAFITDCTGNVWEVSPDMLPEEEEENDIIIKFSNCHTQRIEDDKIIAIYPVKQIDE